MPLSITTIYPPANRPGQFRNLSYENSLQITQGVLNQLLTGSGIIETVASDPLSPTEGQSWFRSDTLQLCIFVSGVTRRSGVFT